MGQMTLMQLSFADTDSGVSATDLNLYHFGKEISDCKINREKTAFVVPERYKVQATLTNLRPLDNLSGQLVYKPAFASERWDSPHEPSTHRMNRWICTWPIRKP